MPSRKKNSLVGPLAAGCLLALVLLLWLLRTDNRSHAAEAPPAAPAPQPAKAAAVDGKKPATDVLSPEAKSEYRDALQQKLDKKDARPNEAVLKFKTDEAYRNFLARADQAGLRILGKIDALHAVRIGYDSLDPLLSDMMGNTADYENVDANYIVHVPDAPPAEDRQRVLQVPFGNNMLSYLGATGDTSQWGRGVTIAVLDSGVAADPTFGAGRVQTLDIGYGTAVGSGAEDGHGTAVAALAAGASPDAAGVAPAAGILSIRVTGPDGTSDSFALADAIQAAVDAGSRIINISMGAYADSGILTSAIDYASAHGTVIVASAGNDGAAILTWPAADPRVISVGAVDALEQQVYFSNAGPQLKMTAPGYGVNTAWLNGQRVAIDGTSASAPIVAGAIAAMMSVNPGMGAAQAWSVLQQYASDGGPPGPDPDYGSGILNLGWAMNRSDPTRVDTAIAGNFYDPASGKMNVVVQNRGGQGIGGLELNVTVGGAGTNYPVPLLSPGATYLIQVPVDQTVLAQSGHLQFRTQLSNPAGTTDQVPANNAKAGMIFSPAK